MTQGPAPQPAASAFSPFRHRVFAVVWWATVVANIGTWMYNAACGWLMTSLDASPLTVSLVQVAANLPMFLLALPAGALADIVDKRRLLFFAETGTTVICAIFALIVSLDAVTPANLLAFSFLIGAGGALTAPAWQAVVPDLVPREILSPALAANSVGINISRALGPVLGGMVTAALGIAAPFWINAAADIGVIGALLWWRPPSRVGSRLPAERMGSAIVVGLRHARSNSHLRATLVRGAAFFLFASAYWALLPLVARNQLGGGPRLYGILMGAIGAGAVLTAFALPGLKRKLGPDRLVAAGTIGTAVTLLLYGASHSPSMAVIASFVAGASWISVMASLNVSAQVALPEWVRGRGLALFVTVSFGALTLGSALWGVVGRLAGLPTAQFIAAAGALLTLPLARRWKLQTGAGRDLTPSMHWPAPIMTHRIESDSGPVMVTVEYKVEARNRDAFLQAIEKLAHERRRDGAYAWGVYEDSAQEGRYLETFFVESWLEHLRQHERVTAFDRTVEADVDRFHTAGTPKVTHYVSAEPAAPSDDSGRLLGRRRGG
jgi:MFS family permease